MAMFQKMSQFLYLVYQGAVFGIEFPTVCPSDIWIGSGSHANYVGSVEVCALKGNSSRYMFMV